MARHIFLSLLVIFLSLASQAELVGGPALQTDDTYYPGEGKFRTIQDIIAAAYAENGNPSTDRDKMLALNRFMMRFVYHSTNRPVERLNNDQQDPEDVKGCFDTLKFLFSYEYAICYASSSMMCGLYEAAGYQARARGVNGHTVPEVYYGGDWHYFDHDMAGTAVEADHSTIASVDELIANPNLLDYNYSSSLNFPYFPWDPISTMKAAFSGAPGYKYNDSGCAAHPTTYHLRRGEKFTRYFNYDRAPWGTAYHYAGTTNNTDGPDRDLTFVYDPPVNGTNDGRPRAPYVSDARARYGNGVFEWTPNLEDNTILDGAISSTNIAYGTSSPKLRGSGGNGEIVISQWTPYVIAGDPSGQDYRTSPTDAIVISGTAVGSGVQVAVSSNNGRTWDTRSVSGAFSQDFSSLGVGRYSYLVKLTMPNGTGFDSLTFRTVTMCSQAMLPHLHDGNNSVTYTATKEGIVYKEPDFSSSAGWTNDGVSIQNLTWSGYNSTNLYYAAVTNTSSPAWYTVRLDAPGTIKKVGFYLGLKMRTPPYSGTIVKAQYSWDNSAWTDFYSKTVATDAEHWRHYFGGNGTVSGSGNSIYLRIHLTPSGTSMGLTQLAFSAWYDTGSPPAVKITHCWNDGSTKTHVQDIAAGAVSQAYSVSCGTNVTNRYVTIEVPNTASDPLRPTANFTFSPSAPSITDTVSFTDTSTTPGGTTITSWSWNFGDGQTSNSQNPTHQYTTAGTYSVTLTVTNSAGKSDSISKPVTVLPGGTPITVTLQQGANGYSGCEDVYIRYDDYSRRGDSEEIRVYSPGCTGGTSEEAHLLIKFDVSSIPTGAVVTDAKIALYGWNIHGTNGIMQMYGVTSNWNDSGTTGANWYNAHDSVNWGSPGGDYSSTIISSLTTTGNEDNTWLEWTGLASTVQSWVDSPSTNNGVIIIGSGNAENRFRSSEYTTDPSLRPKLIVTYLGGGPSDTTPPTVTVSKAVLAGTVSDPPNSPPATVQVAGVNYDSTTGNWTSGDVTFTKGVDIPVVAVDASSNQRRVNVNINWP